MRPWLSRVALLVAFSATRAALAQQTPALEWNVPRQCPPRDVVLRTAQQLGMPPSPSFTLRATVTRAPSGEWVLRVAPPHERELRARTCRELAGAMALYVVWAARATAAAPTPPTPPPPTTTLTTPTTPARVSGVLGRGVRPARTASTSRAAEANAVQALARASGGVQVSLLAEAQPSFNLVAGLRWSDFQFELQGDWLYALEVRRGTGLGGRFEVLRMVARACFAPALVRAVEAGVCAGLEGGVAHGEGTGDAPGDGTRSDTKPWGGVVVGFTGALVPWRSLALRLSLEGGAIPGAPNFEGVLRTNTGEFPQGIMSMRSFHASASLGVELRLP